MLVLLLAGYKMSSANTVPGRGTLEIHVVEADTGADVPARVRIRDSSGADHVPPGAAEIPIAGDRWFAAWGLIRMEVPAGAIDIRVERGTEYRPIHLTIPVENGRTAQKKMELSRWIHMRKLGYVCGENHIHIPPENLPASLAAEGLDFGTTLAWWNGSKHAMAQDQMWLQNLRFGGMDIPASLFDAEVEQEWGSVYLMGLKSPMNLAADPARSNLPFIRLARSQGALVCYHAGWTREVLIDALAGGVDVVNVCNNMFHRHKYLPRRHYANLLEAEGMPEYQDTPEDIYRMNCDSYYRLLNCGLRLAAGAGSAPGAKTTPAGYNRAYVRAGDQPTYTDFLEAWRQGKNFVTNGPMLFLTVDSIRMPGDTIALPSSGGVITCVLRAVSDQPLKTLELVSNGKVLQSLTDLPDPYKAELKAEVPVSQGAWIAGRCTATDELLSDEELSHYVKGGPKPEAPCRMRFAHTSPVYVTVGGKGAFVEESVRQAENMLLAFRRFTQKTASAQYQREILDAIPPKIPAP